MLCKNLTYGMSKEKNELIELCSFANKASIWAVVLVPLNDGSFPKEEDQINLLRSSFKKYFGNT